MGVAGGGSGTRGDVTTLGDLGEKYPIKASRRFVPHPCGGGAGLMGDLTEERTTGRMVLCIILP